MDAARRYNIQCPNENYMLHYTVVRFDVEPPASGQCLDFLRMLIISTSILYASDVILAMWYTCYITVGYHFTATGAQISQDACGDIKKLSEKLKTGYHGSGLTLDFRSNRIYSKGRFHLGITCILQSARDAKANPRHQSRLTSYSNKFSKTYSTTQSRLRSESYTESDDDPMAMKEYFVRHEL